MATTYEIVVILGDHIAKFRMSLTVGFKDMNSEVAITLLLALVNA